MRHEKIGVEPIEISVVLCDDPFIRSLNLEHRGIDKATDVLSFPQEAAAEPTPSPSLKGRESIEPTPSPSLKGRELADDVPDFPAFPFELDDLMDDAPRLLGDIVISLETANAQATGAGWSIEDEVDLLAIHGVLHLLGYDDETVEGAAEMREISAGILRGLSIELPKGTVHPYFIEYTTPATPA